MRIFQNAALPCALLSAAIFTACSSDDTPAIQGDAGRSDSAVENPADAAPVDAGQDAGQDGSGAGGDGGNTDGGHPGVCGNGRIEDSEVCDDGNIVNGDGCSSECNVELGWRCSGEPSHCTHIR